MHLPNRTSGLTLIELVITLSIAAILLAIAAPSFSAIIQNNRMVTQVNVLVAGLNLARSEAIKRGDNVTVCRSNDGSSCSGNWVDGWIVFSDLDNDGNVDAGEPVVRTYSSSNTAATLTSTRNRFTFNSEGYSVGFEGTFLFCDSRGDADRRGLALAGSGRVRVAGLAELASC